MQAFQCYLCMFVKLCVHSTVCMTHVLFLKICISKILQKKVNIVVENAKQKVSFKVSVHRGVDHGWHVVPGPQCFQWTGPTVEWAHPLFNTSEIVYGMCTTFSSCLCHFSSVSLVVFIVIACAGQDAGTQQ